jgi:hypothetical protein
MENLKDKLEKVLQEHQRESGLHMIGGQARLIQRLLQVMDPKAADAEASREEWGREPDGCR